MQSLRLSALRSSFYQHRFSGSIADHISKIPMVGANNSFPLEQAIVDTVREPLLVLDPALRVVLASRAFCLVFAVTREETEGRLLYDLGNGQWNIPSLRTLLEEILPQKTTVEEYEVAHVFPTIGYRTMLLNARRVLRRAQARVPCCSRLRT